jgi:arylsulfatase A-like enzyme
MSVKVPESVPGARASLHFVRGQACPHYVDSPVSLLDIAPTVMETIGVQTAERLDGESLVPFIEGRECEREKPLLFEACWHVAPNPAVAIQWRPEAGKLYMYTYNLTSDVDELYDLNDYEHYRNLAFDEDYRDVKRLMIEKLGSVLQADDRWRCYWHTFRVDKFHHLPSEGGDAQMFVPV